MGEKSTTMGMEWAMVMAANKRAYALLDASTDLPTFSQLEVA